ncbi:MAG: HAD family hydrolase [Parachlamydiaceae bacterium]
MEKKLVVFDCDGVLIDSEYVSSKVFAEALTALGYSLTVEESIHRFTGVSAQAAREIIMQESAIDIPENYWTLYQPRLSEVYETELKPLMTPVLEVLKNLGVTCCVASNSSRDYVIDCLKLTGQLSYFTETSIFTAQQVSKGKPAPDLFLLAAREMGFAPEDCLVIEDSPPGIEAAFAAKMNVFAFMGGSHAHLDCYRAKIVEYGVPMMKECSELIEAILFSSQLVF